MGQRDTHHLQIQLTHRWKSLNKGTIGEGHETADRITITVSTLPMLPIAPRRTLVPKAHGGVGVRRTGGGTLSNAVGVEQTQVNGTIQMFNIIPMTMRRRIA